MTKAELKKLDNIVSVVALAIFTPFLIWLNYFANPYEVFEVVYSVIYWMESVACDLAINGYETLADLIIYITYTIQKLIMGF